MKPMDVGRFFYYWELWEEFFTKRQQIDLYKIKIITHLPNASYLNSHLKALIEAAIRISNDIGQLELKDLLEQFVPDYFRQVYIKYCKFNFEISQINLWNLIK